MRLEIRLYATLRQAVPASPDGVVPLDIPDGATVAQVLGLIKIDPADVRMIMVNGVAAELGQTLRDGDRLGLFPPLGGG
ncbi:MAG: MoaD/ThiS family protein [Sporomusaceae bacterium]|nr:MoaD/ThiS family protein [Sporomusaceae bacterium]